MSQDSSSINYFIENRLWDKLTSSYSPSEIVKALSFKDGLRLAYRLLYNDGWDEYLQDYAIKLLYELREFYSKEWNKSWKYDALIGLACDITYKHEERYEAYKRAFEKVDEPPPRLLIELARCCICPGPPPISYDQAIELVMKALKNVQYADGVSLLCNLYSLKDEDEKKNYWSNVLKNMNDSGKKFNSPSIEPKFLVEEYLRELKNPKRSDQTNAS